MPAPSAPAGPPVFTAGRHLFAMACALILSVFIIASVYRGNSSFQARGNTAGGVILLAFRQEGRAVCLARLKPPQAPAGPENAVNARLWPCLGAASFVH